MISSIYMKLLELIWQMYKHNNIAADVMASVAEKQPTLLKLD